MHAVFLDGAAVKFVKILARGAHVDVKDIDLGVGVFVARQHRVLCGVHAADLRAVRLALFAAAVTARADTLHENDLFGVLAVGRAQELARGRACGVRQTLELERRDDVLRAIISILVEFLKADRLEAGRDYNGAVLFVDVFIPLLIVDRTRGADFRAEAAFAVFQHVAGVGVDDGDLRNGLRERNIDRASIVHAEIKLVRHLLHRAFFHACAAARTEVLVYKACFSFDLHAEIADKAADARDLAVGENADILVLRGVDHLRGQNARGAVERRECLVELCHLAADRRLLLDDVDGKSGFGDIECRLYAGNTAADDERALRDGCLARGERRVQMHLRDGGSR